MNSDDKGKRVRWWLTAYLVSVLLGTLILMGGAVPEAWIAHWPWWGRLLLCLLGAPVVVLVYAIVHLVIASTPHVFRASPAAGIVLVTGIIVAAAIWGKFVA